MNSTNPEVAPYPRTTLQNKQTSSIHFLQIEFIYLFLYNCQTEKKEYSSTRIVTNIVHIEIVGTRRVMNSRLCINFLVTMSHGFGAAKFHSCANKPGGEVFCHLGDAALRTREKIALLYLHLCEQRYLRPCKVLHKL